MFKRSVRFILCALYVLAMPSVVQAAPAPSQDFWDYMSDFSDENGEVLDPVEVDQMLNMKEADGDIDGGENEKSSNQPNTRLNAKKASIQTSSSAMSRAKL